jgi:hypothetical protein
MPRRQRIPPSTISAQSPTDPRLAALLQAIRERSKEDPLVDSDPALDLANA